MPLAEGQVIAGYTIVSSLGAGGMGEVYLAQHPRLPRQDALKVLAAAVCADSEYRERFNREADIAAGLWHPHIVAVHDRGDVDGQLWISMDYVEGTDAGQLLTESYPDGMPPELVGRLITAVAEALDYAHQRGLTHRDVKPANVLISNPGADDERIMLADFGIARRADDTSNLTGTNMTVGTVAYAAPEQLTGDVVDGRADQYALAATAYQLLTGAPPFAHSNPAVVISAHLTAKPPAIGDRRPELSSLGPVFEKALAKSPDGRFAKCVDFARALTHRIGVASSAVDSGATMRASASGPRHSKSAPPKSGRRWGRLVGVGAAAVVLIGAVAAAAFFAMDDRKERREVAERTPSASASAGPGDAAAPLPALPVVVVGADCATLGAAGITEAGAAAYCARMSSEGAELWSLYPGEISVPTAEQKDAVGVCIEQTGATKSDCEDDIARENADPTANDTVSSSESQSSESQSSESPSSETQTSEPGSSESSN